MLVSMSVIAHTVDVLAMFRRGEYFLNEEGVDTTKQQASRFPPSRTESAHMNVMEMHVFMLKETSQGGKVP